MSRFANNALLEGGVRVRVWIGEQRKIKRRLKSLKSLCWQSWTSLLLWSNAIIINPRVKIQWRSIWNIATYYHFGTSTFRQNVSCLAISSLVPRLMAATKSLGTRLCHLIYRIYTIECLTCTNGYHKNHNQTDHKFQHAVAVKEKAD